MENKNNPYKDVIDNTIADNFDNLIKRELSYSSISMYNECRLKFVLHYMIPIDGNINNNAASFGLAYHEVMEQIVSKHITEDGDLINTYSVIGDYLANKPDNSYSEDDVNRLLLGVNQTFAMVTNEFVLDDTKNIERKFTIPERIRGTIDLVTSDGNRRVIVDYKSSGYMIKEFDSELQLKTYFYGLYYSDESFRSYVDAGKETIGIIVAPFLTSNIVHSKFIFGKEDLQDVDIIIDDIKYFLNKLKSKYGDKTGIDLLGSIMSEKHLPSGEGCKFCKHKGFCLYGYSLEYLEDKIEDIKKSNVEKMNIDDLLQYYKKIMGALNNLEQIKTNIRKEVTTYMYENAINKYRSGANGITAMLNKNLKQKSYITPRVLYDMLGEISLQFMETSMKKALKSPLIKSKLDDIVYYTSSVSGSRYLVIK